jgi:ubiquinone/menaquinone biosynthesis C-methylase UbiE
MDRIPEPELMDEPEQVQAYASADFEDAHSMFVDLFKQHLPAIPGQGNMLDLGCGTADITIRMAHAFPVSKILAVDGGPNMLEFAQAAINKQGLHNQVHLQQMHLPSSESAAEKFDIIFSNSLLHHLSDPATLWQTIKHYSHPGTCVFVMDLLRPDSTETARALVSKYANNEPDILQKDFYNSLLAAYRVEEVNTQLHECGLDHFAIKTVSDRHLIVWGQLA